MQDPSRRDSFPKPGSFSKPGLGPIPTPRKSAGDYAALAASVDRVGRIQLIIVGLLTLGLVAIPLYLWRRPRSSDEADQAPVRALAESAAAAADAGAAAAGGEKDDAGAAGLSLSGMTILACHDRGSRKTAPSECDRLPAVESALASAIVKRSDCVPPSAGSGTVQYVADVSFARSRNKIAITTPRDGRTLKSAKLATACAVAVKHELAGLALDMPHEHQRYKIAVTANYAGR